MNWNRAIAMMGITAISAICQAQSGQRPASAAYITTEPKVFPREKAFVATALFTMPQVSIALSPLCEGKSISLQAFNYDQDKQPVYYSAETATPSATDRPVAIAAAATVDPSPTAGASTTISFVPMTIPTTYSALGQTLQVGNRLHFVAFIHCTIKEATGLADPTGPISKVHHRVARLAEATFHYQCSKKQLCGYRPD